jgi:hypothetical protein
MYIFHLGLHKAGSTSLSIALDRLGFLSCHKFKGKNTTYQYKRRINYSDNQKKIVNTLSEDQYNHITECFQKNIKPDLDSTGYNAFIDITCFRKGIKSCEFLYNFFPDAKFILLTRDKESWIKSKINHYHNIKSIDIDSELLQYDTNINEVKEYFSNKLDKLLTMDITNGDGYEILCPFLNIPVIKETFPKSNLGIEKNINYERKW